MHWCRTAWGGSWGHFYSLFYFILFCSILFYHLISWTLWPWFIISLWSILLSLLIRFQFFTRDIVSRFFEKEAYRMPLKTVFTSKWRNFLSNRTNLIKIWTWNYSISIIIAELTLLSTLQVLIKPHIVMKANIVWQHHQKANLPETKHQNQMHTEYPVQHSKLPDLLCSIARNRYLLRSWS